MWLHHVPDFAGLGTIGRYHAPVSASLLHPCERLNRKLLNDSTPLKNAMRDYPKHIKRLLRESMAEAYERELHRELTKLDQSFAEWRNGTISSGELSYRIHQYEIGPSRELYKPYNQGEPDMNVAYAITTGLLNRAEIDGEVLEAIAGPLNFYKSMQQEGKLKE